MKNQIDLFFSDAEVKPTAVQLVARRVATRHFHRDPPADAGDNLVTQWRSCLGRLWQLPPEKRPQVFKRPGLFWRCFNCRPAGYTTTPRTFCCECDTICPWCQAREAQRVFRFVMRAVRMLGEQRRSKYGLFCFRYRTEYDEPRSADMDKFFHNLITVRQRLIKGLYPAGIYCSNRIVPVDHRKWMVHSGGVALLGPRSHENPERLLPEDAWHRGVRLRPLGVFSIAKRLSVALSYPPRLLFADPESVAYLLDNRRRHRLSATVGVFRGLLKPEVGRPTSKKEGE